jgi:diguanylate cyclase (GGDEF)-like protein/PAS domain S-box-containing protein
MTPPGPNHQPEPHRVESDVGPLGLRDALPPSLGQPEIQHATIASVPTVEELHCDVREQLAEIEQVYQYSPVGLVLMDRDYRFVRINERLAEINGLPAKAHIGRTLHEVLPDMADRLIELYRPVYERGEPVLDIELQRPMPGRPDMQRQWLANFFPFRSKTGAVIGLIGAVVDITERRQHEDRLRESEARFRTIFETVTDAIFVQDLDAARFVDVNRHAIDMFGYPRDELLGKGIADLSENKPPYTGADAVTHIAQALDGRPQTFEWRCRKRDGTLFWAEIGCRTATFGGRQHILSTLRNIDSRKSSEQRLTAMAQFDLLTGLANRGVFVTDLQHAIADTKRRDNGLAVFYLDLDHFKDINDTLGHPMGDRLLQLVAHRLCETVRASDTVARFGGDEFAVLMSDLHDPDDAELLARRLVDAMELPFLVGATAIHAGISIGIAVYERGTDAELLLSHADVALYRAKAEGRNTYRFFNDAMDLELRNRVTLADELRAAMAGGELFLAYQPQVDLASGRITGLEALVRWRHPTRGILSPGLFIPIAEHTGLIVALGRWVLAEACRQSRRWLDQGIAPDRVAVNFSALQFKMAGEVLQQVDAALAETGLPAHMLEIELTESTLMETTRGHSGVLEALRERGITIAIDDFGTGYSSLAYLRRFPVDRIKLAQEFIVDLVTDPNDAVIVEAAIGLARTLGADMIAEGVETAQQLALLKSWGCGAAQGYYFAPPMPASDVTALLRAGRIAGGAGLAPRGAGRIAIPALQEDAGGGR